MSNLNDYFGGTSNSTGSYPSAIPAKRINTSATTITSGETRDFNLGVSSGAVLFLAVSTIIGNQTDTYELYIKIGSNIVIDFETITGNFNTNQPAFLLGSGTATLTVHNTSATDMMFSSNIYFAPISLS
ncbi:hypothetical protein RVBP17_2120 [Pseudomonas phage sp. 30-3]|nr:hypothetical protein RVBP17_2120 [Pseudomonas phage sp. 30-3]